MCAIQGSYSKQWELETQNAVHFHLCCVALSATDVHLVCITPSSKPIIRCGSRGTTAAALQGIPFVTATNGARVRVCACVCAILRNTIWTCVPFSKHNLGNSHSLSLNFKRTQTAQQQRYNSNAPHVGSDSYTITL